MRVDLQYRPAYPVAVVTLATSEAIRAEAGAMVSMTSNVEVQTQGPLSGKAGGFLKTAKRALLGGESFFTNLYTAQGGEGEVLLAPRLAGDLVVHTLAPGEEPLIQGTSYVAAPDTIQLDTKFQGLRGLLSGESLFFLHASGRGPVLLHAFGGVQTIELDGSLVVDTGHLVAFTSGLSYELGTAARGLLSSFLSGEGIVLVVSGRGRLYLQTRNPREFGTHVGRLLPPRRE